MPAIAREMTDALEESPEALFDAAAALQVALRDRGILFGDGLLPTYAAPYFVEQARIAQWARQSELLAGAVETFAQGALSDPAIFAHLKLRPEAQELVRIDPGYQRIAVLSRPDAVLRGNDLVFVEFNCDSPAMMEFADVVSECILELAPMAPFRKNLRPESRTKRLLDVLVGCYKEFGGSVWPPRIAITDWEGQKTRFEHQRIAERFRAAGHPSVVCDPRAFRRVDGHLEVDGMPIDIVYRRALFGEILDRQSEVEPLLGAYRDGKICMVNSLRSYLASSKSMLALMSNGSALNGHFPLSATQAESAKLVANTRMLDRESAVALARESRGGWVLKKSESHGGQHVLIPDLTGDQQWSEALASAQSESWVAQEYCPVPRLRVPVSRDGSVVWEEKFFNWNPFLFGGRYAGSIARASDTPLINITLGGGLLPTMPCA